MLEKIAFVLFYAVMTLVATTCCTALAAMYVTADVQWFSAWGSWASGVGTFVAAGVALYVSASDRRERKKESGQELRYRKHFAAYQMLRFCDELKLQLERMNIGNGVDEITWTVLQGLERGVPKLVGIMRPADIRNVVYLKRLYEEAIDLDREIAGHNEMCDNLSRRISYETSFDVFSSVRDYLVSLHGKANSLGQELAKVLNANRSYPEFEVRVSDSNRHSAFIDPAKMEAADG